MSDLSALLARSSTCELCESADDLQVIAVPPRDGEGVVVCGICVAQMDADPLDTNHWRCLQGAAWSEVSAVQVLAWRLLHRLDQGWAVDLLDQIYLDDDTLDWAKAGQDSDDEVPPTVDSNGTRLADGDSVTLIKDLPVKGANFTAKRGTMVKGIRLTDDPGLVEGRVNKTGIYLKTEFLKKA